MLSLRPLRTLPMQGARLRGLAALVAAGLAVVAAERVVVQPLEERRAALAAERLDLARDVARLNDRIAVLSGADGDAAFPDELVYRADSAAAAEIALQRDVLGLAEAAGISPYTFGPSPPAGDVAAPRAGFDVEFEAGYAAALDLLAAIEAHRPRIALESLLIRQLPPRPDLGETPVSVRLSVWCFTEVAAS